MPPSDRRGIVGLISDTHGLLREEAVRALAGTELIVHAGDVGRREILEKLREIAPTVAVRGNIDTEAWASELPETAVVEAAGVRILVLHRMEDLGRQATACGVVVTGHSHQPGQFVRDGVLYVNPGSAGPRRFRLPVTVAILKLPEMEVDFIRLDREVPPRGT